MHVESWITPEETPSLAEAAAAVIEARMSRFEASDRAAFWASVRKAYNTPYNAPPPRKRIVHRILPEAVEMDLVGADVSSAALAAVALAGDSQAA